VIGPWVGASPDPFHLCSDHQSTSNKIWWAFINNSHGWRISISPVHNAFPYQQVMGSNLMRYIIFLTNHPVIGCHVASHVWATCHLFTCPKGATCQHLDGSALCLVRLLLCCHMSPCYVSMMMSYWRCIEFYFSLTIDLFHVWENGQSVITLTYIVHLRK